MHEEIGGEGAERDEVGVREIDLYEHAVNQRQAQRHQNIETSENDAVDRLLEDDRCCHRRGQFHFRLVHDMSGLVSM